MISGPGIIWVCLFITSIMGFGLCAVAFETLRFRKGSYTISNICEIILSALIGSLILSMDVMALHKLLTT